MATSMEGNWQLLPLCAEKLIVARGTTDSFKRTFPLSHPAGEVLIAGPVSAEEVLLEQNSAHYSGLKLMRGMWEEEGGANSNGTFFPLASTAKGVVWCSAGRCLMPYDQRRWRCGNGLLTGPLMRPLQRTVVDLGWLTAGCNGSELAEHKPSQPSQRAAGLASWRPRRQQERRSSSSSSHAQGNWLCRRSCVCAGVCPPSRD